MRAGITTEVKREVVASESTNVLSKDEFTAKWEKFGKFMAKTPVGSTKRVRGRVTRVFGPVPIADVYQGQGKVRDYFVLDCEIRAKGMEGIRIPNVEVANSLDDRAKWNHLYYAVTGEAPTGASMTIHPGIACTRDVWLVVKKEGARNDGKYGGHYFKVTEFNAYEDEEGNLPDADDLRDEDWVEPTPEQWTEYKQLAEESMRAGKRIRRRSGGGSGYVPAGLQQAQPQAITQPAQRPAVSDDVPFDDEDDSEDEE